MPQVIINKAKKSKGNRSMKKYRYKYRINCLVKTSDVYKRASDSPRSTEVETNVPIVNKLQAFIYITEAVCKEGEFAIHITWELLEKEEI